MRKTRTALWCGLLLLLGTGVAGSAAAAEIVVGEADGKAGEPVTVPVHARGVENLAGVKLVLTYDANRLTFERADKTPLTTSLMHIVNSKKAGRLIVVMAGARGVDATDGTILDIHFRVPEGETEAGTAPIELREVQVMSDTLREVAATGVAGGVRLGGEAPESVSEAGDGAKPEAPELRVAPTKTVDEPASATASPPSPPTADPHPEGAAKTGPPTPKAKETTEAAPSSSSPESAPTDPEAGTAE